MLKDSSKCAEVVGTTGLFIQQSEGGFYFVVRWNNGTQQKRFLMARYDIHPESTAEVGHVAQSFTDGARQIPRAIRQFIESIT
jgi:hypothetical protein